MQTPDTRAIAALNAIQAARIAQLEEKQRELIKALRDIVNSQGRQRAAAIRAARDLADDMTLIKAIVSKNIA